MSAVSCRGTDRGQLCCKGHRHPCTLPAAHRWTHDRTAAGSTSVAYTLCRTLSWCAVLLSGAACKRPSRGVPCGSTKPWQDTRERNGSNEPQELKSEADARLAEAERLRAAEKFMTVGTGEAECIQCGYLYDPRKGDPEYPVSPNTQFQARLW